MIINQEKCGIMSREHALNLMIERVLKREIEFYNIGGSEKEIKRELIKHCKYMGGALREWSYECEFNKVEVSLGLYNEKRTKFVFTWNEMAKEILKRNNEINLEKNNMLQLTLF